MKSKIYIFKCTTTSLDYDIDFERYYENKNLRLKKIERLKKIPEKHNLNISNYQFETYLTFERKIFDIKNIIIGFFIGILIVVIISFLSQIY